MDLQLYIRLSVLLTMVTVSVKGTSSKFVPLGAGAEALPDVGPLVRELVEFSLLKIGDGAELVQITDVQVQEVPGTKYRITMLVNTYILGRVRSIKVLNECKVEIVDEPTLRWVTGLECKPLEEEIIPTQ